MSDETAPSATKPDETVSAKTAPEATAPDEANSSLRRLKVVGAVVGGVIALFVGIVLLMQYLGSPAYLVSRLRQAKRDDLDALVVKHTARDSEVRRDDCVEIFFDPKGGDRSSSSS